MTTAFTSVAFGLGIFTPVENRIMVREGILVEAQVLVQKLLNQAYGNPRDCEETNPKRTKKLFKQQRRQMADTLGWSKKKVKRFFADDANIKIKDLAEVLHAFNYDLIMKEKKRK